MHPEAYAYVERAVGLHGPFGAVVEFGGRDVNGSVRPLFAGASYLSVDLEPGDGVDVTADAATVNVGGDWDCVVCCEVLEHAEEPERLIEAARRALRPGGLFVMTCAGEGREPHSAVDGGQPRQGEHYRNISPVELQGWLAGWERVEIDVQGTDLRCTAWRADG